MYGEYGTHNMLEEKVCMRWLLLVVNQTIPGTNKNQAFELSYEGFS